ncbi:hypothetical protein GCM10010329_74840 [Streptomyces spiroverticillatus]|uniref:Uncharacterized protein n=1 Tax=Streptomyces finlayi TaxID=67296 RepID=A0A918X6B6_9ACTN|nr:hypothetical protein GCM10010329_74840 [Streptomyces spiroverticillatus]GHD15329.1 hypothetical protein GCM10010334_75250 [Streptomyces finlayi]
MIRLERMGLVRKGLRALLFITGLHMGDGPPTVREPQRPPLRTAQRTARHDTCGGPNGRQGPPHRGATGPA